MPLPAGYRIVPATAQMVDQLPAIERAAAALFPREDLPAALAEDAFAVDTFAAAARDGRLWAALDASHQPVGFALVWMTDGQPHLEELDVLPEHARRGIGRALIETVVDWAQGHGYRTLTLVTFRHIAWNAPFYRRPGFEDLPADEEGTELRRLREMEAASGLDPSKRVAMRLDLTRGGSR